MNVTLTCADDAVCVLRVRVYFAVSILHPSRRPMLYARACHHVLPVQPSNCHKDRVSGVRRRASGIVEAHSEVVDHRLARRDAALRITVSVNDAGHDDNTYLRDGICAVVVVRAVPIVVRTSISTIKGLCAYHTDWNSPCQ